MPSAAGALPELTVQDGRVGRIDAALEGLQPVALLDDLGHAPVGLGHAYVLKIGQRGLLLGGPHVDPDDVTHLDGGVGLDLDLVHEGHWLIHLLYAVAVHVVLPAVVNAAEPRPLVAAEPQRGEPVGAVLVQNTDVAIGVAEGDQVLAKQAKADRRTVRLRQLRVEHRGEPVAPKSLAHGGARADLGYLFVLFPCEHSHSSRQMSFRLKTL